MRVVGESGRRVERFGGLSGVGVEVIGRWMWLLIGCGWRVKGVIGGWIRRFLQVFARRVCSCFPLREAGQSGERRRGVLRRWGVMGLGAGGVGGSGGRTGLVLEVRVIDAGPELEGRSGGGGVC